MYYSYCNMLLCNALNPILSFADSISSTNLSLSLSVPPPIRDQRQGAALPDHEGHPAPLPQGKLRSLQIRHQPLEQVSGKRAGERLIARPPTARPSRSGDISVTSLNPQLGPNRGLFMVYFKEAVTSSIRCGCF